MTTMLLDAPKEFESLTRNEDGTVSLKPGFKAVACTDQEALPATNPSQISSSAEPFGYFKAEPFGWTDCAETDDGAIALYTAPPVSDVEPVAYVTGYNNGYPTIAPINSALCMAIGTALYSAPPAPSVPPVRSTGQWESSRIADYNRGWNACREAMLAAPQQEPLSDERILSIGKRLLDRGYYPFEGLQPWVYSFARAIEREILGGGND